MAKALLKFIEGEPGTSTATILDLNQDNRNIYMRLGGFSPGPGQKTILFTQDNRGNRIDSERANAVFTLIFQVRGDSAGEAFAWAYKIIDVAKKVQYYQEESIGNPIYLTYSAHTDFADVPLPFFGQMFDYFELIDIEVAAWPTGLHGGTLINSPHAINNIQAQFTATPTTVGKWQQACTAKGNVFDTDFGVVVGEGGTNEYTNPFTAVTFDTGWSVSNATLKKELNTDPRFCHGKTTRSVLLVNTDTGTVRNFTQTLVLGVTTAHVNGWFVKKADGSAVTSSDCTVFTNGSSQTTTFVEVEDDWYYCYASSAVASLGSTYGIQVKAGKRIYVSEPMLCLTDNTGAGKPNIQGYNPGVDWDSTAHASSATSVDPALEITLENEMTGEYWASFWFAPLWAATDEGADRYLWEYYVDASNYIRLAFRQSQNDLQITHRVDASSSTSDGAAVSWSYGDWQHFIITQLSGTLYVYLNGTEYDTLSAADVFDPDGVMHWGTADSVTTAPCNGIIDGCQAGLGGLTAAQVLSKYNNELAIKGTDLSGATSGRIGGPIYWWTEDGDNIIDPVYDSTPQRNYGYVGGVSGDGEAEMEFRVQLDTTNPPDGIMIGIKHARRGFNVGNTLYIDLSGSAAANTSGGQYETQTGTGNLHFTNGTINTTDLDILQGIYTPIPRMDIDTNPVTLQPVWYFGAEALGSYSSMTTITAATTTDWTFKNLLPISLKWGKNKIAPTEFHFDITANSTTGSSTVAVDFILLMPWPMAIIKTVDSGFSVASGDLLYIKNGVAYIRDADGSHSVEFEHIPQGDQLKVRPGFYNYIFFLLDVPDAEGDDVQNDVATVDVYVRPGRSLPGGAWA